MEWVMTIIDEMRQGNFSFLIWVAAIFQIAVGVIQIIVMTRRKR